MALKAKVKPKLGTVQIIGWGNLADAKSFGEVLRRDGDFLIVCTKGTYFSKDCKFWLSTGKLVGTSEVAGFKIVDEDLRRIRRILRLNPADTNINESLERDNMALTLKKKVTAAKQEKNGKRELSPGESVNEVIKKRGPGRPRKEVEPETKPSAKRGQTVEMPTTGKGSGKRGRPRKNPEDTSKPVNTTGEPGKRGRKPTYTLPEVGKTEMLVAMSDGAYSSVLENLLPNIRSKKTTEEEKDFVNRFKAAVHVPVKGYHFLLNKATAAVFLAITEKAEELWAEAGVAGAHYRRGTTRVVEEVKARFKLKGGITPFVKETPAPVKKQSKPLQKAAQRVAAKRNEEDEEEDEEEETPKPKRGRPKLNSKLSTKNKTVAKKKSK